MRHFLIVLSIILITGCKSETSSSTFNDTSTNTTSSPSSSQESSSSYSSPSQRNEDGESDSKYEDGTYCADVEYYNPNTGTQSDYQLEVEVEGGSVTQIDFPQGYLDDTHFSNGGELDNGETEIDSDKGYTYTVKITGTTPCVYDRVAVQCMGIDKDGSRCRKLTADPSGYCPVHRYQHDQSEENSSENGDEEQHHHPGAGHRAPHPCARRSRRWRRRT